MDRFGNTSLFRRYIAMEMRKLGSQGPEISVIGYGAWEAGGDMWGPNQDEQEILEAMNAAIDAGMNWIDTAEVYGRGHSEELVGKAVGSRRDDVLIFTKVAPRPAGTGFRADQVHKAIEGSLSRLGTDHVDLYQLHWTDPDVPIEETWSAMAEVHEEGLARSIGVCNFDRPLIERCLTVRHVDSVQNRFSLLDQEDEQLLPWLDDQGIGYLAYAPLAYGLLTGAITMGTKFHEGDWRSGQSWNMSGYGQFFAPRVRERHLRKVELLRPIAERLGTTVASLALRWVVEQRGVTAAIAGSRNPEHTRSNATAGDLKLDAGTLEEIDRIFA
jgi:aryl-alcohol dehydrogenase-like predicted oxidoreductase